MRLSNDLREFIELLNSRGVEYLIVGAYASPSTRGRASPAISTFILVRPDTDEAFSRKVGPDWMICRYPS